MRKTLVVFYSNTGICRELAQMLSNRFNWPTGEIRESRVRVGLSGLLRCVADSCLRRHPPIRYEGPGLEDYEVVVLVAPIWLYRLAGPMRSFVAAHKNGLKRYAVISVMGGRGAPNAIAEIGKLTGHSPLLAMGLMAREVEDGSCVARLQGFCLAVEGADTDVAPVRPASLSPYAA